jgi:Spy/CpxP family protein refolding chaperone
MKRLAITVGLLALLSRGSVFAQGTNASAARATNFVSRIPTTNQAPADNLNRRVPVNLSAEQRKKLEEANKAFAMTATPLVNRLATARRELDALVSQDKVDEAALRAKVKEMAEMEGDVAIARARRFVSLRAFMTAEQARRYNQAPPMTRPFQPSLHGQSTNAPSGPPN